MARHGGEVAARTPPSPRSGQNKDREEQAALRAQAFDMRLAGHTQQAIAERLGRDRSTISRWLQVEINNLIIPRVEELRRVETERMDSYLRALEEGIVKGDVKAINAALRVSERRARLLGLDAPVKIESTVITLEMIDREMARLNAELADLDLIIDGDEVRELPALEASDPDAVTWSDPWQGDGIDADG
jgi:transcriptional regulator with XRE-family HTH domain